jgi:hypothetical protein
MDAVLIILQFFFNRQRTVLMGLTLFFRLVLRTKGSGGTNPYPPDCCYPTGINAKSQSANLNCRNIPITLPSLGPRGSECNRLWLLKKSVNRNVLLAAIIAAIEFSSHLSEVAASVLSGVGWLRYRELYANDTSSIRHQPRSGFA